MSKALVWIPGDQLLETHPAIAKAQQEHDEVRVVLVESQSRIARLPYQRKKLVLLLSAMRHYVKKLQGGRVDAHYIQAETLSVGLKQVADDYRPDAVYTMAASEYGGRQFQYETLGAVVGAECTVLPNTQFLVGTYNPIPDDTPADKSIVMEHFYRKMRKHFDLLMDGDEPAGGEWNYDKENRKPLPKDAKPPAIAGFAPDSITQQVMDEVVAYAHAVGSVEGFDFAVNHADAQVALDRFIDERLREFGPYEDAMSADHDRLWHSILSPYLNIGLLTPLDVAERAAAAYRAGDAPINSVEGFVRQVIGWREFMYWQYWRRMPDMLSDNAWNATRPMPQMFWDADTPMNCIKHVAQRAHDTGYTHHIERLMIVTNFCTLAGVEPQAVVAWFTSFYIDAYDWVMQPNVVGMGLNADGGIIATKPYISSANYINKMSDYCTGCAFARTKRHGENACPFNYLYWNFLIKNEDALRSNPRSGPAVLALRHLDDEERAAVQAQASDFLDALGYYGA